MVQAHILFPVAALAAHRAKADQVTVYRALSLGMDNGEFVGCAVAVGQTHGDIVRAALVAVDLAQKVGVFVSREMVVDARTLQLVVAVAAQDDDIVGYGYAHPFFIAALAVFGAAGDFPDSGAGDGTRFPFFADESARRERP